jgi:hypothetical protein
MPAVFAGDGYRGVDKTRLNFRKKAYNPLKNMDYVSESSVKFTPCSTLIPGPLTLLLYAGFNPA